MGRLLEVLAYGPGNGWRHMDGWAFGWMWLWPLAFMVVAAVIAVGVVLAAKAAGGGDRGQTPRAPAGAPTGREILQRRYANGELSTEEYRERLREIS